LKKILILILVLLPSFSFAEELYQVTLLRAAPGNFPELIQQVKDYKKQQHGQLSIMRHSQGDHWDLMLLEPAGKTPYRPHDFRALADFQETFLAKSNTAWSQLKQRSDNNEAYHIEMFQALHGQVKNLYYEREMENQYLALTQRPSNEIFETLMGSDVDIFTIGYHKDLKSFAKDPELASEVFEKAAVTAGFKNRSEISFYLRQLILAHHDTLATAVK